MAGPSPLLNPLQLPGGGYAMVALDQRESLRTLMGGAGVDDDRLVRFKRDGAESLTPFASAVLLDRQYGLRDGRPNIAPGCGLILAVDVLDQAPNGPVQGSDLDPEMTPDRVGELNPAAIKLLLLWRDGETRDRRDEIVGRFMELGRAVSVPCVLEGVVRPRPGRSWDGSQARDDAIEAAAEELSQCRPDIYKAEVPGFGDLPAESLRVRARRITALLDCPWVVLSSGVRPEAFADVVDVVCSAGASGFLAGRAIWANAFTDEDPAAYLATHAVGTLRHLVEIVRSHRSEIAAL